MDFGIALSPAADSSAIAKRAESLGFSHVWFYDTQLLAADVFVAMATAALATNRIKLGTGVLIPTNRIAPVAANGFASLNAIAPGRIIFGVGTGFTGRNTMGLKAMPLDDLEVYVRIVKGLLNEQTVEWEFERKRRKIRFLNPDLSLINTRDPVPVHVSAFGARSRALTASLGDGWINFGGAVAPAVAQSEQMAAAWTAAGRPNTCYRTLFGLGCVLREGEDVSSERAMAQAGPLAAVTLHSIIESGLPAAALPEALQPLVAAYRERYESIPAGERHLWLHRGHLMFIRPDEADLVRPELVAARTFTASKEELRDRIRALAPAYEQFVIQLVPGQEEAIEDWARVFESV